MFGVQQVPQLSMKRSDFTHPRVTGLNTEIDGTCMTIKAVYYKVSLANFLRQKDWGATGVAAIIETG